ncbi:MAG: CapA family protein [Streptomycetales bacterium]
MGFTLVAGGDVMLTSAPSSPCFADVAEVFRGGDAAFVNLELPLTRSRAAADKMIRFRADPDRAADLAAAHITVATVANNHAFDYGPQGLSDTLAALRAHGVRAVGAGDDLDAALAPCFVDAGGVRMALLGITSTLPNGCGAGVDRPGVAPVRVLSRFVVDPVTIDEDPGISPLVETTAVGEDVRAVTRAVERAKRHADAVVVACHWGVPYGWVAQYQGELATYQQPLGRALIDAGADAVIGHHPHVLHGVEMHRGRPIFYSVGNLLFHAFPRGAVGRSEPLYSLASLHGEINRYGAIARLHWDGVVRPAPSNCSRRG